MKSMGIRILDKKNRIVSVELPDILKEIKDGNSHDWSILYLYATGNLGPNRSIPDFENEIINAKNGFKISWNELVTLSKKFWDLMDITIIASRNINALRRYKNDEEMYEKCDIVIEMIDSNFWEVFSKDQSLISRLQEKFNRVEILTS